MITTCGEKVVLVSRSKMSHSKEVPLLAETISA